MLRETTIKSRARFSEPRGFHRPVYPTARLGPIPNIGPRPACRGRTRRRQRSTGSAACRPAARLRRFLAGADTTAPAGTAAATSGMARAASWRRRAARCPRAGRSRSQARHKSVPPNGRSTGKEARAKNRKRAAQRRAGGAIRDRANGAGHTPESPPGLRPTWRGPTGPRTAGPAGRRGRNQLRGDTRRPPARAGSGRHGRHEPWKWTPWRTQRTAPIGQHPAAREAPREVRRPRLRRPNTGEHPRRQRPPAKNICEPSRPWSFRSACAKGWERAGICTTKRPAEQHSRGTTAGHPHPAPTSCR